MIELAVPSLPPDAEDLVLSVLRSGHIAQGPMVERFEQLCATMAGTREAVAMSNGTVTLEASLQVAGIGPGDEVITSPLTFAATLNAIIRSGATARFADVRLDYTIDPAAVEALVGPSTAAILPVHLYGLPSDMTAVAAVAQGHGLAVIEDAAQAHGAMVDGNPVGSFGMGSFSFYATKNVTTGEGGVVTTSDPTLARRLRLLRNQGMVQPYQYELVGTNLRMTDLQAALGVCQVERLDEITKVRTSNALALSAGLLQRAPSIVLPAVPPGRRHAWHLYTILLPAGVDRAGVIDRMRRSGVQAATYYPALVWNHPPYRHLSQVVIDDTPTAADVSARCLSIPVRPGLDDQDLEHIIAAVEIALR